MNARRLRTRATTVCLVASSVAVGCGETDSNKSSNEAVVSNIDSSDRSEPIEPIATNVFLQNRLLHNNAVNSPAFAAGIGVFVAEYCLSSGQGGSISPVASDLQGPEYTQALDVSRLALSQESMQEACASANQFNTIVNLILKNPFM